MFKLTNMWKNLQSIGSQFIKTNKAKAKYFEKMGQGTDCNSVSAIQYWHVLYKITKIMFFRKNFRHSFVELKYLTKQNFKFHQFLTNKQSPARHLKNKRRTKTRTRTVLCIRYVLQKKIIPTLIWLALILKSKCKL